MNLDLSGCDLAYRQPYEVIFVRPAANLHYNSLQNINLSTTREKVDLTNIVSRWDRTTDYLESFRRSYGRSQDPHQDDPSWVLRDKVDPGD